MKDFNTMTGASRKSVVLAFFTVFVAGLWNPLLSQDRESEYTIPVQLNDGWEVASLEDVGIDTAKIMEVTNQIRNERRFIGVHSMLIVKNGKLVHEAYFWEYQRNSLNVMASIFPLKRVSHRIHEFWIQHHKISVIHINHKLAT